MTSIFPTLILNARPAAGKSEIVHFLRQTPLEERKSRFHVGTLHTLDDFPMLWTWFEEDALLERIFNRPRLHTTHDTHFIHDDMWHLLIRRLGLDYAKWRRDNQSESTVLIEFSRGSQHGGYRAAYQHLSDEILRQAACLYLQVSFEESLRKNTQRANSKRLDSILEHSLPEEKMHRLYRDDDWAEFTSDDPEYLTVREFQVPYAIFPNEDDVTTMGGSALMERLENTLGQLWELWMRSGERKREIGKT